MRIWTDAAGKRAAHNFLNSSQADWKDARVKPKRESHTLTSQTQTEPAITAPDFEPWDVMLTSFGLTNEELWNGRSFRV